MNSEVGSVIVMFKPLKRQQKLRNYCFMILTDTNEISRFSRTNRNFYSILSLKIATIVLEMRTFILKSFLTNSGDKV